MSIAMNDPHRKDILTQVFSTRPAKLEDSYIRSYAFEHRYALTSGGKLLREPVFLNKRIPSWLRRLPSLGDYEKYFLNDILHAPGPILAYRGGTGSGKSSLVGAIVSATGRFSASQGWDRALNCNNFTATIDLQAAESYGIGIDAKLDGEHSDPRTESYAEEKLFQLLSVKATDTLFDLCHEINLMNLFQLMQENPLFSRQAPYRELIVKMIPHADESAALFSRSFSSMLEKMEARDKFFAIFHIFLFLGHLHKTDVTRGKHEKSMVLFIDNSDKLHHVLLTKLVNYLKEICGSASRFNSGLRIALFLRLSTSKDLIGALPEADYRYHSSPDPTEIILHKSLDFLLGVNSRITVPSSQSLTRAKFAVLELLIELLDPSIRDFSESLDALGGTNIRNAFTRVVAWCSSAKLEISNGSNSDLSVTIKRLANLILMTELRTIVKRFNVFLCQEIVKINRGAANPSSRQISLRLERILHGYIKESAQGGEDINSRMKKFLLDRITEDSDLIEELVKQALSHVNLYSGVPSNIAAALAGLSEQSRTEFKSQLSGCIDKIVPNEEDTSKFNAFTSQKNLILGYLVAVSDLLADVPQNRSPVVKLPLPERAGRQNRFQRTVLLYDVDDEGDGPLSPVNLVSLDNTTISTSCLRVIYYLCEQQESEYSPKVGVMYDELKAKLQMFGYTVDDVRNTMRKLTALSTRLIYSRVADHHYFSGNEWEGLYSQKPMYVSWAGYKYFESLLTNPSFVQWMLSSTAVVKAQFTFDHERTSLAFPLYDGRDVRPARARRVVESMQNAVDGLEILLDYEVGRLSSVSSGNVRTMAHLCQSPVVDLMHRCVPAFLRTINYVEGRRLTINSGRMDEEESAQFHGVKVRFLDLLLRGQSDSHQYFGGFPLRWRDIYEACKSTIDQPAEAWRFGR
jgi:hypothetical protein